MKSDLFKGFEEGQKIYGLLGHKLGHSYSPQIHSLLGFAGQRRYTYGLFPAEPEDIEEILAAENLRGLNVTIPYKQTVLAFCDEISPEVLRIGAANTLVKRDEKITAYNTDIYGFRYMVYASGIQVGGKKVLVLGSGGASKAVVCALEDLGAREIVIISRTGANSYKNLDLHADADIIVNTTPVGMYPNNMERPLDIGLFPNLCGVLDIVYNPEITGLLLDAEERGIPHAGGLHMLVAQAKQAYELFTDKKLPEKVINEIVTALRNDMENIVLIGMPGCGKTTIARALSAALGRDIIDTDQEIERKTNMTIPEIFRKHGEARFRELEHDAIVEYGKLSGKILSLGGGAILNPENYPHLHQNGKIYFIRRETELLATDGRPLSKSPEALKEMQKIRLPLYRQFADVEISNDSALEDAVNQILSRRKK